jgi:hypothetical protein
LQLVRTYYPYKAFRNLYIEQVKTLEAILGDAAARGHIRAGRTDVAAFTICEMTRGLIVQRLFGWSKETVADDVEFLFEMVWKGSARLATIPWWAVGASASSRSAWKRSTSSYTRRGKTRWRGSAGALARESTCLS